MNVNDALPAGFLEVFNDGNNVRIAGAKQDCFLYKLHILVDSDHDFGIDGCIDLRRDGNFMIVSI